MSVPWADPITTWEGQSLTVKFEVPEPDGHQFTSWCHHHSGSGQTTHSCIHSFNKFFHIPTWSQAPCRTLRRSSTTKQTQSPNASHTPAGIHLPPGKTEANKIKSLPLKSFHFRGRDRGETSNNMTRPEKSHEGDLQGARKQNQGGWCHFRAVVRAGSIV